MDFLVLLGLVGGLALLVLGGEMLVRGASALAAAFGIPSLVIGLTVVAFGTSSPELAVSVQSSLTGNPDIAVGNVVGSNIFNVLFILGVSALIAPLIVASQLIRLDVPIMIGASFLFWALALDGRIGQLEGFGLFLLLVAYTGFMIWQSRRSQNAALSAEYDQEYAPKGKSRPLQWLLNIGFVIGGLVVLVIGSRMLVDAAVSIALALGVSELVIGLTIVAAGTSLPEVAASVVAAIRGERDIAVGNVVGSNLFNIFMVLGLSALVSPTGISVSPAALAFDIPVMVAVAVASLPIFFSGYLITRWEGVVFLAYYAIYTVYLILTAQEHAALQGFTTVMTFFVLPITVLTLIIITARSLRANTKTTTQESAS